MVEEKKPEDGNGKLKTQAQIAQEKKDAVKKQEAQAGPKQPPKDFKIAEIWIKDGTVALDACPDFWADKLRAIGILDYCRDVVKDFNPRDQQKKSLIQRVNMAGFRKFIRGRR